MAWRGWYPGTTVNPGLPLYLAGISLRKWLRATSHLDSGRDTRNPDHLDRRGVRSCASIDWPDAPTDFLWRDVDDSEALHARSRSGIRPPTGFAVRIRSCLLGS